MDGTFPLHSSANRRKLPHYDIFPFQPSISDDAVAQQSSFCVVTITTVMGQLILCLLHCYLNTCVPVRGEQRNTIRSGKMKWVRMRRFKIWM